MTRHDECLQKTAADQSGSLGSRIASQDGGPLKDLMDLSSSYELRIFLTVYINCKRNPMSIAASMLRWVVRVVLASLMTKNQLLAINESLHSIKIFLSA